MKDVCWRLPLFLLLAVAMVMIPLTQTAQAVPGKGSDCDRVGCHTLAAGTASSVGKGVQDTKVQTLISGQFERDSTDPEPHQFDTDNWDDEIKCVVCHTDLQNELSTGVYHSTHPIYSVVNNNHINCIDCHDAANARDNNYHGLDPTPGTGSTDDKYAWLRFDVPGTNDIQVLCDKCHDVSGLSTDIGVVGPLFRITQDPVDKHGLTKYDTVTWTSCSDFADGAYDTGCHGAHTHATNSGLVGIGDYETADLTVGVCDDCHPAQDNDGLSYNIRHDYDEVAYNTDNECDVCHDFAISADHYQTAGFHTEGNIVLQDLGGGNTTAVDAFCVECHDGIYPGAFTGWQGGARTGGGAGNVDVDGNATDYGYEINGHGLNSGSSFAPAAWKTTAAAGNPSPVDAMAANFTNTRTCYACHDPHGTTQDYIVKATINGNVVIDGVDACTACHNNTDGIDATSQFAGLNRGDYDGSAHFTDGILSCYGDTDGDHATSGCHDPHGLGEAGLAYKSMMPEDEEDGCTVRANCHGATTPTSYNKDTSAGELSLLSHHPVTANGTADYNGDGPFDEVECTNCHNPHLATLANPVIDPDAITTVAADAASPGAPVPDFDKFTDFCLDCHDGAAPPAGYGVAGAVTAQNHWGPGSGYPPSENPAFTTQCWHCHDSHGDQNIKLVGNTRDTIPGSNVGVSPSAIGNRAIYNVYDAVWAPAAADTNDLVYNAATSLDPTSAGNNDGSTVSDDGVCDRCHNITRGDNETHSDAFPGVDCRSCHIHNGTIDIYATAFPMLAAYDCYACHSAATVNNFKTEAQFGGIDAAYNNNDAGGTLANGTWHSINYSADADNDCYDCHVLNDATFPHKSGTVVLQVGGGPTYSSTSGDYQVALADSVAFCMTCHGGTPPEDVAGNFDNCGAANTPVVSADAAGTKYTTNGHGSSSSLSPLRDTTHQAGPPALGCTTCHQYHGGSLAQDSGDPTIGGTMTVIDEANEDMLEKLGGVTYTDNTATAKDNYCADTCHNTTVLIDNVNYTAGDGEVFDHTYEVGDGEAKDQTGCPQNPYPFNDCDTHPTNAPIPNAAPKLGHFNQAPNLPLAAYDYSDDLPTIDWSTNAGNIICTSCHEPHALTNSDSSVPAWGKTDLQMLKDNWSDTGGSNTGALCSDVTNYCHK